MSKPKPASLPAGTVVGGYHIVKRLASGGFGVVYLAEDAERRLVALKEYIPASLAERFARRTGARGWRPTSSRCTGWA